MLGLNEGEDNVIFTSIGRADPFQKGTYLLMNDAERFLKAPGHEKAQMILVFSDSNPRIGARVKELEQDPALKGRLYISYDKFVPRDVNVPMYAGSDFFMMPSVYEPYGQTQLEGYSMGVVPIGHGVDGIRSSVSDPDLKANPPEKVEEYGQTGILMKPYDAAAYKEAIAFEDRIEGGMEKLKKMQWNQLSFDEMQAMLVYLLHNKQLPEDYAKALQQAQTHFSEAMDRAFNLAQDPDKMNQVRINGMKYFGEEHKDEKIAQKYVDAINLAMQERDKRLASGTQLATFA